MTNEQLEDYSALWANGVNVGKIWNKIKARFVSGYHDQTSYSNSWRMQARTNLGIGTPTENYMWIGGANNAVTTIQTSALGRTLLSKTISANAMWYASSANTLAEVTTSHFGRGLLSAQSGSVISGLYAERASRLTNTSAVGSTSLPVYFTSGGVPAIINALSVSGNIQSTGGGVSAVGLADLAGIGGGGGSNASEIYIGTTRYLFNENGQAYLPAYPSDFYTQSAADNKFATIAQLNTINAKIPSAATSSNQLADKAFVNSSIATATATFRGTNTTATTEAAFLTWANGLTHNLNDYVFWKTTDSVGNVVFKRYKYGYDDTETGTLAWRYEYDLNNSSFTSDQWNAINSYATAAKIDDILPKSKGEAKGDLITFSAASTPVRLGIGTTGQFLKVVSGLPAWASFATPTVAWTDGTTAGPKLTVTTDGGSSTAVAIPAARKDGNNHYSGIVTTGAQTFAGAKTFDSGIVLPNAVAISSYNSSQTSAKILQLTSTNNLHLGDTTSGLHNTYINGNNVYVRLWNGTSWNSAITIASTEIGLHIGTKKEASLTAYGFSALDGGVSANGLVDLAIIGGGGGSASSIKFGSASAISADENGLMTVPFSIASNMTNAVSVSVGGATANITPSTLRTSLGLGTVYSHGYGEFVTTLGVSGNTLTWSKGGTAQTPLPIQGVVTAKGSNTQPVYVSADGTFSVTKNYAGGTSVTLNGESKSASIATLYAPTAAGTAGQWLKSSGSGAPVWESPANMLAGMAAKLETEAKPNQEFIFRNSPKTIGADSLKLDRILGRTLAWNQLVQNPNFLDGTNHWTGRYGTVSVANGICTMTPSSNGAQRGLITADSITIVNTHKYYIACWVKTPIDAQVELSIFGTVGTTPINTSADRWKYCSTIITSDRTESTYKLYFLVKDTLTTSQTVQYRRAIFVDLTLMFGSGKEPSVEDFEKNYLLANYEYSDGELISNNAESLESVGDNLWDEEWEVGSLNYETGAKMSQSGQLVSKNYIPVIPFEKYYIKLPAAYSSFARMALYDAGYNYLGGTSGGWYGLPDLNGITMPANARYVLFTFTATTYNKDICFRLFDSTKNDTYEPHKRSVLDLHLDNIQVKSPNIWDEEWVKGTYSTTDGETFSTSNSYIASKNKIAVNEGETYYFNIPSGSWRVLFYDKDKVYIPNTSITPSANTTFTIPLGVCYIRFQLGYNGAYNNDICINVSDPAFNGKYFPHGVLTFNGLKQAGDVRDEIVGGKFIRRMGSVDLGTSEWHVQTIGGYNRFDKIVFPRAKKNSYMFNNEINSVGYVDSNTPIGDNSLDKAIGYYETDASARLYIRDDRFSTVEQIEDGLRGHSLNYELATYETYELISPIPSAMPAGTTERRLPEDTSDSVLAPFACDMTYGTNPGDILASGIAWEKIWGRATLNKGILSDALVSNVVNNGEWFEFNVGNVKMYLSFAVADGAFRLAISDDKSNPTISKEFTFATLDDNDIDAICD